jgi:hypothetical protein
LNPPRASRFSSSAPRFTRHDIRAATPILSATTLAAALDEAVKTATHLLDFLVVAGIAVEVTRRSKRRLLPYNMRNCCHWGLAHF